MYILAWSDGTKPERTPRSQEPGPTAAPAPVPSPAPVEPGPAVEARPQSQTSTVEVALETRPGWRPEQFPGIDGRCRETASQRMQARQPISRMTANPFLVGEDYLSTLALQDAFLTPKSSHLARSEST